MNNNKKKHKSIEAVAINLINNIKKRGRPKKEEKRKIIHHDHDDPIDQSTTIVNLRNKTTQGINNGPGAHVSSMCKTYVGASNLETTANSKFNQDNCFEANHSVQFIKKRGRPKKAEVIHHHDPSIEETNNKLKNAMTVNSSLKQLSASNRDYGASIDKKSSQNNDKSVCSPDQNFNMDENADVKNKKIPVHISVQPPMKNIVHETIQQYGIEQIAPHMVPGFLSTADESSICNQGKLDQAMPFQ
ncbi:hypothetical protein HCN44_000828 [Aphidius gifuensis]|uniref:Uncharacterized protein n=1 Tax=Aphidius gifuensis TaxID=684658 RepID=A0A835CR97_APHGI|nr:hypothetical protein HCN44_000828 [Aphidius gifuensis]